MGTTPGGLVYPEPTAPVRDGADAMRYFLEQLDQDPVEKQLARPGSMNVASSAWTRVTGWGSAVYSSGTGLSTNTNGVLCTLAGRYWCEGYWTANATTTGRRGAGLGLTTDSVPVDRTQVTLGPFSPANALGVFTSGTLTVPAGGIVQLFLFQETGSTFAADATKFSLTVRRLRLGQSHP